MLQTRMPFWGAAGTIGGGVTLTAAFTAETPFLAVQLFWMNLDTVPRGVDSAAAAPTVTEGDAANPVNPSGVPDPSLWQPVTFGGQRSGIIPAAVQGTTGFVPDNDRVAGLLVSDVMPIAALPRFDGAFPLLLTRSFSAQPMPCAVGGDGWATCLSAAARSMPRRPGGSCGRARSLATARPPPAWSRPDPTSSSPPLG